MKSTKPQPNTTDPAPTLTDAEVLNRFQGLSASIALAGKRHGATMKPGRDAARAELERRLAIATARPAGVTVSMERIRQIYDMADALIDAHYDAARDKPCTCPQCRDAHAVIADYNAVLADAAAEGGE